jgi:hypothetical protein
VRAKQIRHAAERLARGALLGRRAVERFRDFLEDSQRSRLGKATAIFQRQRLFFDATLFLDFVLVRFGAGFFFFASFFFTDVAAARRAGFALRGVLVFGEGFAE